MSLLTFTDRVKDLVKDGSNINYKVKFAFEEGVVHVDATQQPDQVSNEDKDADTTIHMSLNNANKFLDGQLNVTMAFMTGKMKVDGSMGVAMKVAKFVESKQ
ncbi:SCP2 sterol-binding domain-containing protein [Rapidithrix thailandica]|uniref:SCP2 sterol-binding domain-containing protein n=1 Tax=Rapidithrix thailandica TaxID=413964 RepID=A0AAW9SAM5_9BACT